MCAAASVVQMEFAVFRGHAGSVFGTGQNHKKGPDNAGPFSACILSGINHQQRLDGSYFVDCDGGLDRAGCQRGGGQVDDGRCGVGHIDADVITARGDLDVVGGGEVGHVGKPGENIAVDQNVYRGCIR